MATVEVDTATVTVDSGNSGRRVFRVPAFTRSRHSLSDAIMSHLLQYLQATKLHNAEVSTADFAFYLLAQANKEPFYMEEPTEQEYDESAVCPYCKQLFTAP